MKIKVPHIIITNIDYRNLEPIQGNLKDLYSENFDKLKKSLTEKGGFVPLFVWIDGDVPRLLDGHQRHRVFLKEGIVFEHENGNEGYEYPCVIIEAKNLKDAKERLLLISSQYGTITKKGLDDFAFDLDDDWLSGTVNFDAILMDDEDENEGDEEGEPIEEPKNPISVLGDIYELHSLDTGHVHRIQCGDSTDSSVVEKTMNGEFAILMVTDPPYGVEYDSEWRVRNGVHKRSVNKGKVMNDDTNSWKDAYMNFQGDACYVWHPSIFTCVFSQDLIEVGLIPKYQIIWNKSNITIGRGDYHYKHEPCWYCVRDKKTHNWQGDRKQKTVWDIPSINTFGKSDPDENSLQGHGTQKPVECMARPIRNNTKKGEGVYDPFIGSGTTLIACEKMGRICYGQELDPVYVDMIVMRWISYMDNQGKSYSVSRNGIMLNEEELNDYGQTDEI